jgi:hypothetical protein
MAAVLVAAVLFWRYSQHWDARRLLVVAGGVILSLAAAVAVAVINQDGTLLTYWGELTRMLAAREWGLSGLLTYTSASIDHTWFIAGWHRYIAPEPWRSAGKLLVLAGIVGGLFCLVRPTRERPAIAIAWLLVLAQIVAVLAAGLWGFLVPHGRYAEPALVPMALLLWLGVQRLLNPVAGRYGGVALVAALAIVDAGLLTDVLIPAYLPW